MRADYHVHTEFSDDSQYPFEQVVRDAITKGLDEICFTEHVDYGVKFDIDEVEDIAYRGEPRNTPLSNANYPVYFETYNKMKQKYADKISLKFGLEFGMQSHTIERYEKLFKRYPFDFIILSIHQVGDEEYWTGEIQKKYSQKKYNEQYYKEFLYLVQNYHNYSVLGHLDYIVRYDPNGVYPFEKLKPIISEILKTVIKDGKGIEVNTSSHRYGLTDTTPSREILKLYKELGGEIITIGSDSHKPEHLGAYIDESKELLRELGYTRYCTFDKMQPVFHRL